VIKKEKLINPGSLCFVMAFTSVTGKTKILPIEEKFSRSVIYYFIHPGQNLGEGDPNHSAKEGIQKILEEAIAQKARRILVRPIQGDIYVDSNFTYVRESDESYKWVEKDDLAAANRVVLVGGRIRQCLASVYSDIIKYAKSNGLEQLDVTLPLDALFTESVNGSDVFNSIEDSIEGKIRKMFGLVESSSSAYSNVKNSFFNANQSWKTNIYYDGELIFSVGKDPVPISAPQGWTRHAPKEKKKFSVNLYITS